MKRRFVNSQKPGSKHPSEQSSNLEMAIYKHVFFYCFIDVLMNIFVISFAGIKDSDICLDRALSFASKYDYDFNSRPCDGFYGSSAELFFPGGSTACKTKCQITLNYVDWEWNKLTVVSFMFDGYNLSSKTDCTTDNEAQLLIDCSRFRKEQLNISWNKDCKERYAECSNWNTLCVCLCDAGYIMKNGHCIQAHQIENQIVNQRKNDENIGAILGSLFGGLLLGFILTAGFGFIIYRKFRSNIQKRADLHLMSSMNETHNGIQYEDILQRDKQRKVLNVSPLTRSEESQKCGTFSGKQHAPIVIDDVYNHLNEKGESQDEDTYDHACAATMSGQVNELGDYSYNHGFGDGSAMSGGTETDDYSTLNHI